MGSVVRKLVEDLARARAERSANARSLFEAVPGGREHQAAVMAESEISERIWGIEAALDRLGVKNA